MLVISGADWLKDQAEAIEVRMEDYYQEEYFMSILAILQKGFNSEIYRILI